ncbi:MAG TPA: hypothetical protein VFS43_45170 [Polyangiaceae bacterium]|nr:hypothetical protein [Polyangiaceae bacterium]
MSTQTETKNKVETGKQAQKNVKKAVRRRRAALGAGQEKAKPTEARADKAKTGEARTSKAKAGEARAGMAKAGEVRTSKAKAGEPRAGEAMPAGWAAMAAPGGEAGPKVSYEAAEQDFRRWKAEIDAVSLEGRPRITASIPAAVEIGLGAAPYIDAKKEEIQKIWPQYDPERAGRLREHARAALFAHLRVAGSAEGATRLRTLLDDAGPLRERMLRAAEMHAYCGDLDAERVADIRRGVGHRDTALDLMQLAMLFREARAALAGRTPITDDEIARAAELGSQIIDALGQRRLGSDGASAPAHEEEERAKAFWLFYETYDMCRRGMAHLRWVEGDVDQLVPSLFSQIGLRRSSPSGDAAAGDGETPAEPADPSEGD